MIEKNKKLTHSSDFFGTPHLSEWEKYKYYTQNDPQALALKQKLSKLIQGRGLSAVMNDSKWLKLQSSIQKLPFPPPYVEKLLHENKSPEEVHISDAPDWFGDWNPFYREGMSLFFTIEYIKVSPRYAEHSGHLVAPKIWDETEEFERLLIELYIPFETDKGTFTIYGYR